MKVILGLGLLAGMLTLLAADAIWSAYEDMRKRCENGEC